MSRSGGMEQLFKGIVIGVILILAIFGTMSLFEKRPLDTVQPPILNTATPTIEAPTISINPNSKSASINEEKEEVTNTAAVIKTPESTEDTMTPVLEGERETTDTKEQLEEIEYGMLSLSTRNPSNRESLKANYTVYDINEVKVAESNNAGDSSYRLPIGQYKVITILAQTDVKSGRTLPAVKQEKTVNVTANLTSEQIFELEPPSAIGVLQVSAVHANDEKKAIRANFIVQKENGETIATRNNISNSLFKLDAGSYKVTVRSGENSDFKTVVVEAGESAEEVFRLQDSFNLGRILVRIFDTRSNTPVRADVAISTDNGKIIQELISVSQTELSVPAGNYKIVLTGENGQSNKDITVTAGQISNEIFRLDAPSENNKNTGTPITDQVTIKPIGEQPSNSTEDTDKQEKKLTSNVRILALNAIDRKPIKSNIYIQTPNGKHLNKKTYVDAATFQLAPGTYKVTVRSKNRKNLVKTIRVTPNQAITESFLMVNPNQQNAQAKLPTAVLAPPKPAKNPTLIPNGFLNVAMLPRSNQIVKKGDLNTHFIVATETGRKVVELTGVATANFKLDTGSYVVTAIHKNKRRNQRVLIKDKQSTRLTFNTNDFLQANKGVLQSRVIDVSGRPLKANLFVTNKRGQIIARANNVSVGVFKLPPRQYNINVDYRGLKGSEPVSLLANETTVQTFTIAPNQAPPAQRNAQPRDIKNILKDKIKQELKKQF